VFIFSLDTLKYKPTHLTRSVTPPPWQAITTLEHFHSFRLEQVEYLFIFSLKLTTNYIDKTMETQLQMSCYVVRTAHDKTETISSNIKTQIDQNMNVKKLKL